MQGAVRAAGSSGGSGGAGNRGAFVMVDGCNRTAILHIQSSNGDGAACGTPDNVCRTCSPSASGTRPGLADRPRPARPSSRVTSSTCLRCR